MKPCGFIHTMAVPSRRLRAGKREIDNKAIVNRQRNDAGEKKEITPEAHEARLKKLRDMGLLK